MIFAEGAPVEATWVGPVVATFGAAFAALFSWLSGRDKLRFDAERVELKARLKGLEEKAAELKTQTAECHAERDAIRNEFDVFRQWVAEKFSPYTPPPGGGMKLAPRATPQGGGGEGPSGAPDVPPAGP